MGAANKVRYSKAIGKYRNDAGKRQIWRLGIEVGRYG